MKHFKAKIAGIAAVAAVALPAATYAATTSVDVTANFRTAITLAATTMDFGDVEFAGTAAGASADMDVDGSITYGGDFSGAPTGTVGAVDVTSADAGADVDLYCDATATLADGSGNSIQLNTIEVADAEDLLTVGTCDGLSGSGGTVQASINIGTGANDTFVFGGTLDGGVTGGTFGTGAYSTATGGDPIDVEVFYQ